LDHLCRFALKNGRVFSTKARNLCCFARKAIARRRERRYLSWCRADQFRVSTQLATPLGKKKKNTMSGDPKDPSGINPSNIIPVTLKDLSEEEQREIERELEEEKMEKLKQKLACYQKTRDDVFKREVAPAPAHGSKASNPVTAEEIGHLIDVSVASKFSTVVPDLQHMARAITQSVNEQLCGFKHNFNQDLQNNLVRDVRSVVLQVNDERCEKQPVHFEINNSAGLPNIFQTSTTPANTTMRPLISANSGQTSQNYNGDSANNFMHTTNAIVSTSVPQNYSNYGQNVSNPNSQ